MEDLSEGIMTFKQYVNILGDDVDADAAFSGYANYKANYERKKAYFEDHKHEEELKGRYHPLRLMETMKGTGERLKFVEEQNRLIVSKRDKSLPFLYDREKKKKKFKCKTCPTKCDTSQEIIFHLKDSHMDLVEGLTSELCENFFRKNFLDDVSDVSDVKAVVPNMVVPRQFGQFKIGDWIVSENGVCGSINEAEFDFLPCRSMQEAERRKCIMEQLSQNIPEYFVKPVFPVFHENRAFLVVEKFERLPHPIPNNLRIELIKQILKMAFALEAQCKFHGDLSPNNLVLVDGKPKFVSIPVDPINLEIVQHQTSQIFDLVHYIIGDRRGEEVFQNFSTHLRTANTVVEVHSLLYHQFVSSSNEIISYFPRCMHVLAVTDTRNGHIKNYEHFYNSCHANKSRWKTDAQNSAAEFIRYGWEAYGNFPYNNHMFIWNKMKHVNETKIVVQSTSKLHERFRETFPDYVKDIFDYMHCMSYNAYLGTNEHVLKTFSENANHIVRHGQRGYSCLIKPLIHTGHMCFFLLGKIHIYCNNNCDWYVQLIAEEIKTNIKILEGLKIEEYWLQDLESKQIYSMSTPEKTILALTRCVYFFLEVLRKVMAGHDMTLGVKNAALETIRKFLEFYKDDQSARLMGLASLQWPAKSTIENIIGVKFAIAAGSEEELQDALGTAKLKLIRMLKNVG